MPASAHVAHRGESTRLLILPVCGSLARAASVLGQIASIERTGLCPALGHVERSTLNPASCLEFPNRTVEISITATSYANWGFRIRKFVYSEALD